MTIERYLYVFIFILYSVILTYDFICISILSCAGHASLNIKLPWIFPGAPLTFNGAPENIQGNFDRYVAGPLGGNSMVTDGFPRQGSSNVDIWCFLCYYHEQTVDLTVQLPVI